MQINEYIKENVDNMYKLLTDNAKDEFKLSILVSIPLFIAGILMIILIYRLYFI